MAQRPSNHTATLEEILTVQVAVSGTTPGSYPDARFARMVLNTNGGNVQHAKGLFLSYLQMFQGSLEGTQPLSTLIYRAIAADHDRGQEPAYAWFYDRPVVGPNDSPAMNPIDPEVPVHPSADLPPTFNADEAYARLMSVGATYRGNSLDTNEYIRRVERITFGGVPVGWETKEYRLTVYLIVAGVVNAYPNAFNSGDAPPAANTLQEWLDVERLVSGGGRGPGGND